MLCLTSRVNFFFYFIIDLFKKYKIITLITSTTGSTCEGYIEQRPILIKAELLSFLVGTS